MEKKSAVSVSGWKSQNYLNSSWKMEKQHLGSKDCLHLYAEFWKNIVIIRKWKGFLEQTLIHSRDGLILIL